MNPDFPVRSTITLYGVKDGASKVQGMKALIAICRQQGERLSLKSAREIVNAIADGRYTLEVPATANERTLYECALHMFIMHEQQPRTMSLLNFVEGTPRIVTSRWGDPVCEN